MRKNIAAGLMVDHVLVSKTDDNIFAAETKQFKLEMEQERLRELEESYPPPAPIEDVEEEPYHIDIGDMPF